MSFRLEEKISINNFNIFDFKKWLFSKGAKILYPPRIINSIYFDNNLKMYCDSNEGTVPRKKIRIRTYQTKKFFDSNKSFKKETKITYYNYRYKEVEKFNFGEQNFFSGIHDQFYGLCKPNLNVLYKRNYYLVFNTRFTLDEDIEYRKLNNGKLSNFSTKDKNFVLEIKSQKIDNTDYLKNIMPLPRSRFSKYCRGIELVN